MKTVYLEWSDNEGIGFLLPTIGFRTSEIGEIGRAFAKAGYTARTSDHFVSALQPRPDGRERIAKELETIGYGVQHGGLALTPRGKTEITAEQVLAAENAERERRRPLSEVVDRTQSSKGLLTTPEIADIRVRWIIGEISADEAIALINAEIKKTIGQ